MPVGRSGRPLRLPMVARDRDEEHRASTPLELFFDLCFVVAVAQASQHLEHAFIEQDVGSGLVSFLLVFFAIWWGWMNYSWFASAYDNDDVVFRLLTFVQISGALIVAAGVPRAFDQRDFDEIFIGYLVMRTGLVALWLRAARHDPLRRATALRYAAGVSLCTVGWGVVLLLGWPVWAFLFMVACELAVPAVAERAETTPWHPQHISERYGLFTLIVLGEAVAAVTLALQGAIDERTTSATLYLTAAGGTVTAFAMWWVYFAKPVAERLVSNREGFVWGYGHYVVWSSLAVMGAGVAVNIARATHETDLSRTAAGAMVTVPVAVYLIVVWLLHTRLGMGAPLPNLLLPIGAVVVLLVTFTGQPVFATGLAVALLVAVGVVADSRGAFAPGETSS